MKFNLLLLLVVIPTLLFGQDHYWTKSSSRNGFTEPKYKTAIDAGDNIYLVSNYKDTIDLDPGLNYEQATTTGGSNVFIEKLSPAGDLIWVKTIKGDNTYAMSVTIDGNDLFVTGYFNDTVDFNLDAVIEELKIAEVTNALFVLKLDLDGNYQNAFITQMSNRTSMSFLGDLNYGATTKIDNQGNIITAGSTLTTVVNSYDIDPSIGINLVSTTGISDGYVQKISSNGNLIWGFLLGGANVELIGMEGICGLQIDSLDNIYVAGKYSETANFNPLGVSEVLTVTGIFNTTGYIAKYTPNGILDWVSGLTYGSRTNNISLQDTSLYITGDFSEPTVFGDDVPFGIGIPMFPTGVETYILRMNLDGTAVWVNQLDTVGNGLRINSTLVDHNGNLCLVVSQLDSIDFDFSLDSSFVSQGTVGQRSSALIRYNPNGVLISADGWYNQQGENHLYSIEVDSQNSLIFSGDYNGITDFDIGSSELNVTSSVQRDWFISKYTFTDLELILSTTPSDSIGMCNGQVDYVTLNAFGPVTYTVLGHPNWVDFNDTLCDGYYIMVAMDSIGRVDTVGFNIYINNYYNYVDTSNIINDTAFEISIDDCDFDFITAIDSAYFTLEEIGTNEYVYELWVSQNGSVWIYQDTINNDLSMFDYVDITIYCSDSVKSALKLNRLLLNINIGFLDIHENELQNLIIYPNPFTSGFYLSIENDTDLNFNLVDNLGREVEVYQNNIENGVEFNLPNASEGIYFLNIMNRDSNENRVIKLIKRMQ